MEVIESPYRVIEPASSGGSFGAPLVPYGAFQPVPMPVGWMRTDDDGKDVEYFVKRGALSRKTPKGQIKIHVKGYNYVTIDFIKSRLNEYADNGRWTFLISKREHGRRWTQATKGGAKEYIESMVGGWLLAPGLLPTYGEGSAPWAQDDQGDPRFSESTAWNSAESAAIKSAAKKLGIGADIKENEDDKVLEGMRSSCASMYELLSDEQKKSISAKMKKNAPLAYKGVESFDASRLDEDNVEDVMAIIAEGMGA